METLREQILSTFLPENLNQDSKQKICDTFEYFLCCYNYGENIHEDFELLSEIISGRSINGKTFSFVIECLTETMKGLKKEDLQSCFPGQTLKKTIIFFVLNINRFHQFDLYRMLTKDEADRLILEGKEVPVIQKSNSVFFAVQYLQLENQDFMSDEELRKTCENFRYLCENSNGVDMFDQETIAEALDILEDGYLVS